MTTTASTVKYPSRKVRPSPIDAAIVAADRAVTRAVRRQSRSLKRIDRLKASIAKVLSNSGQFDTIITALKSNADALRQIRGAAAGKVGA